MKRGGDAVVGRFAPSPSGRMHAGNLLCALLAWLSAKSAGGRVILRIEDLDALRCRPSYARQIEEDLAWLGLTWDAGGAGDAAYCQSRRGAQYQAALEKLKRMGLVYPCFCTRTQLHAADAPHHSDGGNVYPGTCRNLTAAQAAARARATGRQPGLRLRVPDETISFTDGHLGPYTERLRETCGDFLLRRSDGMWAYQLAVVADDAAMGVTEVVRGSDLMASTPRQILLYRLLGLPEPRFYHLPLLRNSAGQRLSKRDGALSMETLRRRWRPEELTGRLAFLAGLNPSGEPRTPADLLPDFSWDKVPKTDCCLPEGFF